MTDKIIVRLANGLDAIEPEDQIDVISICGMGGTLIRDILEAGRKKSFNREGTPCFTTEYW